MRTYALNTKPEDVAYIVHLAALDLEPLCVGTSLEPRFLNHLHCDAAVRLVTHGRLKGLVYGPEGSDTSLKM